MSTYSPSEVAAIVGATPLTFEKAKEIGAKIGKSHRSVIAKAKSLGVVYIPKAKPVAKGKTEATKADVLVAIRKGLALSAREGDLTKAELLVILSSVA
tara:strand:- start:1585 stop:1878 length:294 start_codon:yes stop_codon:yes gene_type:complete